MERGPLAGCGVLVTRPAGQSQPLCRLIESAGGRPLPFPTIAIEPTHDPRAKALLAEDWDLMYFVSPNAVEQALALVAEGTWPRVKWVAAVGRGTARVLEAAGRAPDLVPNERYDSESLLALPELADMQGRRVLIVRGEGGRELFAQAMRSRGAEVFYAEVYRRVRPQLEVGPLLARWREEVQLAIATSDEILDNLVALVGEEGRHQLLATPLVVIAERTAQRAQALGFTTVRVAARAEDQAILESLLELAAALRR